MQSQCTLMLMQIYKASFLHLVITATSIQLEKVLSLVHDSVRDTLLP